MTEKPLGKRRIQIASPPMLQSIAAVPDWGFCKFQQIVRVLRRKYVYHFVIRRELVTGIRSLGDSLPICAPRPAGASSTVLGKPLSGHTPQRSRVSWENLLPTVPGDVFQSPLKRLRPADTPGQSAGVASDQYRGDAVAEQAHKAHVLTAIEAFGAAVGEDQKTEPPDATVFLHRRLDVRFAARAAAQAARRTELSGPM